MSQSTPPRVCRFSLTWRVIALSSLLLLSLVVLFSWLGHANLTRQFESSRAEHNQRQHREIQLALERSEESLGQLASMVASVRGLGEALQTRRPASLETALEAQWPTLQLDAGIDEILAFDSDANQQAAWGEGQALNQRPVQQWVRQVLQTEMPLSALRCSSDCRQYAAMPVLVEGESVGAVILSRSLADVTRQAQQVSGSDVALLVVGNQSGVELPEERLIDAWGGTILALTRQEEYLPLLKRAARASTIEELLDQPLRLSHRGDDIELSAIRMDEDSDRRSIGYFLLASDITPQIKAIGHDTRTLVVVGLGGWLIAELLLLVILLSPMARLRRLAGVLPSLARGGFAEARATIPRPRRLLVNEIDVVEGATLALAGQLETLEQEVSARGELLAERVKELARERDFIGSLLDTARVFIVTQDASGRIGLVNDYALTVMGTREERLKGRLFEDVFAPGQPSSPLSLTSPGMEERPLVTPDGQQHTIAWYHAPLASASGSPGRISVGLDITERKAAEARLTWLAERDPLTGLYNRRYFQEALDDAMRHGQHGAMLLTDLDQFKDVNELSGHQAGDLLLRKVARVLTEELGHRGVIARLGGDEFALLLKGADSELAIRVGQQISQILEGTAFDIGGRRHRVAASTGITLYPEHADNPIDLMASADMAMYKAKACGTQRWHLLEAMQDARAELQERIHWEERIHLALMEDAFELMVQPIVRLADRDVRHYEVLLRMRDEQGELVSPVHFIPVAERSGQIIALDRWVLRHCLRMLGGLKEQGISLAVNLSGQSLHDDGLEKYLAEEIAASGADPEYLILEVTETAAVTDFSTARGVLQAIRDLGCRTALDDFGVGFSSFHYLSQLPVDYIKIDGSFIRNLTTSAESQVIVRAIADIAAGFGKQAIAEFVNQESLIEPLSSYGIAYGQGYHLGKPIPVSQAFGSSP
ncbi:EAL domain-containing protein [Halomonas mongoliensis]|uniref:EAL domain-containing protein n=1 Tax=Halomonas mongoliensis TaxID=321265 RepID=A0ABU1GKP0_9GAMM|nr:EAL domain-containing protein [Halomonas mongoliensis]MDR5892048.1 EAL domain-containing protein [Halomonas mongoliensis]